MNEQLRQPKGFSIISITALVLFLTVLIFFMASYALLYLRSESLLEYETEKINATQSELNVVALELLLDAAQQNLTQTRNNLQTIEPSEYRYFLQSCFYKGVQNLSYIGFNFFLIKQENLEDILVKDFFLDSYELITDKIDLTLITNPAWEILVNNGLYVLIYKLPLYSADTGKQNGIFAGGIILNDNKMLLSALKNYAQAQHYILIGNSTLIASTCSPKGSDIFDSSMFSCDENLVSSSIVFDLFSSSNLKLFSFQKVSNISELRRIISRDVFILILTFFFIILLMAYLLSVFITNPIQKLIKHTESLVFQDKKTDFGFCSNIRELNQLSLSFNHILGELLEREKNLGNFIDYSPMGLIIFDITADKNLVFSSFNPAAERNLKRSLSHITGKKLEEVLPNFYKAKGAISFIKVALDSGCSHISNAYYEDHNLAGTFDLWAFKMSSDKLAFIFNNVTERIKMENELKRIEKLESMATLSGGLAHDFNNILMGLFGNIEMIKNKLPENHELNRHITISLKAAKRAKNLTRQLLDFAKSATPLRTTVDLKKIIDESLEFDLSGSNLNATVDIQKDLWHLQADKGQISQVLTNIILNSRQAIKNNGKIDIIVKNVELSGSMKSHLSGKYILIKISDNGPGIDKKIINNIFNPYFTTKKEGTGLGLVVVQSIIAKHGGHIEVESSPKTGTTFSIFLPVNETEKTLDLHLIQDQTQNDHEIKKLNVLLMDDEEIVREILKQMLESFDCQVTTTKNGEELLEHYKTALESNLLFDVVIMDLTIQGGMGGKEAIRHLLEMDPKAKAIVCSGYSTDEVMRSHSDYGFKGCLTKPFEIKDIKKTIIKILGVI